MLFVFKFYFEGLGGLSSRGLSGPGIFFVAMNKRNCYITCFIGMGNGGNIGGLGRKYSINYARVFIKNKIISRHGV